MSDVFSPNIDRYLKTAGLLLAGLGAIVVASIAYYATPKYTRVGYEPVQPIAFSHALHAGQLGMDCTWCHTHVGQSPHANVPHLRTCMNCHGEAYGNIKSNSVALAPLREAWASGQPVPWIQIHRLPDYAYFNHAVHVRRGVGCVTCHGKVNEMPVVRHAAPLSMAWCLDCHRDPAPHLRPAGEVTNLDWVAGADADAFARALIDEARINPPTSCSGCHR